MAGAVVYLNGRFVAADQAVVSALDRGFLYGDGLFETMRAYGGRVFRLDAHLRRMAASADAVDLPMPSATWTLGQVAEELLRYNNLWDAALRLTVSRGPGDGVEPPPEPQPTVLMAARPLARDSGLDSPVDAIFLPPGSAPPAALARHKTLCFLPYLMARAQAKAAGAQDAVLVNADGQITEATTSNLFVVSGRRLLTPPLECGLLPGIMRQTALRIAGEAGLEPEEAYLTPDRLRGADEAFLTNSVAEITPLRRCDGAAVGSGEFAGARRLHAAYRALVARELGLAG